MRYKYCLIVSQYCHSYHTFIVNVEDDFYDKAKKLIEDLEDYKREKKLEYKYGDLDYRNFDINNMFYRYNLNDEGDVYFINSNSINELVDECLWYSKEFKRTGYIKNEIIEKISNHHYGQEVQKIVEKHFQII